MAGEPIALWILIVTCGLHWCTVSLLVRRVRESEQSLAWLLLGLAISVLATQQTYELYLHFASVNPPLLSFMKEVLGVVVAGLLLGSMVILSPILKFFQRNKELLEVIDERNVIICQFHERISRTLRQVQIALEVGKPTNHIVEQVTEMSKIMDVFLEDLKAGVLLGSKFEVALKTLVEDLTKNRAFSFTLYVDPLIEDSLTYDQGAELLHIMREAIQNCVQYSEAKKGVVSVKVVETQMVLEVADNGKGFEFDLVAAEGHGLGHMARRAKKIGARLKVNSQLNKGTSILIELPRENSSSQKLEEASFSDASELSTKKVLVS